jgi:hypothetical protein
MMTQHSILDLYELATAACELLLQCAQYPMRIYFVDQKALLSLARRYDSVEVLVVGSTVPTLYHTIRYCLILLF